MSVNLFGRSYSSNGSTDSDYLIKTKGKVKVQCGSKFIDLIKDGALNVDSKCIYRESSVGSKDGIYVLDDSSVILVVNGNQINLNSDGNAYVSFLKEQASTPDQKYYALQNIGFSYSTLTDLNESSLQNGIIYIENTQKLYIIKDGVATEYYANIQNPYPEQFVLSKVDDRIGSIIIKGAGINNSLAFTNLFIYNTETTSNIDSNVPIIMKIGDTETITVSKSETIFNNSVSSQSFQSVNANAYNGFRLYIFENQSNLEVDNLNIRKSLNLIGNFNLLPTNSITLFYKTKDNEIPDGWELCDGKDGRVNIPNLQENIVYIIKT